MLANRTRLAFALLLAAFVMAVTGCSKKPEEALVGKWGFDIEAMKNSEEFKKMEDSEREMATKMLEGMAAGLTIEFTKDKMMMEGMGEKQEATYTIKATDGAKLTIETVKKEGETEEKETLIATVSGDTMTMQREGDKEEMKLKRK